MKHLYRKISGSATILILVTFSSGLFVAGGLDSVLGWTNTETFCVSCHEMRVNLEEYKETAHYSNKSGIKATCSDCHVPKNFTSKIGAKVRAAKDVYYHLLGNIDTKEKYESHRLTMAEKVWSYMKKTNSRECRSCHKTQSMALDEQPGRAARKHKNMDISNKTCIDCHKGVAHELPEDFVNMSSLK